VPGCDEAGFVIGQENLFNPLNPEVRMTARNLFMTVLLALCFLPAVPAPAAVLKAMALPEMVEKAETVFVGTVVKAESAWNPEHTHIYTKTTFSVHDCLKGHAPDTIVIETMGGVVEGMGMMVPGMPLFRTDEKDLLFVTTNPQSGSKRVLGWAQGRFQIRPDPGTGREVISRELRGASLVGAGAGPRAAAVNLESIRYLDDLKAAIRRLQER
jgi:hypothetical protein